jgi:uncharacterized protein (UPF0276 family)
MKIGINYSAVAERLLRAGEIEVDVFKCPEWPELLARVRGLRPCYPHFAFRAGRGTVEKGDWDEVRRLTAESANPHFNMHLAPSIADFPGMRIDAQGREAEETLVAAMVRDVRTAQRELPGRPIALEGVMWDPMPPWEVPLAALDPKALRRVIVETDARLLLDLAHADISARRFGRDARDYIGDLPLDRLQELHVSGTALGEDGLWHDHHPMREEDWGLVAWALEEIARGKWPTPAVATLEYGGIGPGHEKHCEEGVMRRDLARLRARAGGG